MQLKMFYVFPSSKCHYGSLRVRTTLLIFTHTQHAQFLNLLDRSLLETRGVPEEGYYRGGNYLWMRMQPHFKRAKKIQVKKSKSKKIQSRAPKIWETISRKWQETPTHLGFCYRGHRDHFILKTFSLGLISILREQSWERKRAMKFASPQIPQI